MKILFHKTGICPVCESESSLYALRGDKDPVVIRPGVCASCLISVIQAEGFRVGPRELSERQMEKRIKFKIGKE